MTPHRICTNWAFSIGPGYGLVTHDREESHLILFVARLLRILPEEYHAEYAGALHLKVSGEWSIHPSTAFATLTADPEIMLEVLANLLRAHPECRPRLPKAITT